MKGFVPLLATVLLAIGIGVGIEAAIGGPHIAPSVYPAPIASAHDGYLTACPNPQGIESFTSAAVRAAVQETEHSLTASLDAERLASDQSFWSSLHGPKPGLTAISARKLYVAQAVAGIPGGPASYLIRKSCGSRLVDETGTVVLIPLQPNGKQQNCDACRTGFYYVDRRGHALLYFSF